jgi:simple sugar transport system permease protein
MTSLLMNFVARGIASYTVRFHLNDEGIEAVATPQLDPRTRLPSIPGSGAISFLEGVDWSLLIILAVVIALAIWERRTVTGYETKMVGLNTAFGRYGGVPVERRTLQVMSLSGGIAGLVGVMLILGEQGRYFDGELIRANFAWIGLMVALLAAFRPGFVAIVGFGFAALQIGGLAIQREVGVASQFSLVVQALIIVALAAVAIRKRAESKGRED